LCFARTNRLAIVALGTRNARAMSSVLSPAQRPQRQGDLRIERERRMAAREDELQPLVGDRRLVVHIVLAGLRHVGQARLRGERAIAPDRRSTPHGPRIRRRVRR
jgi:hypothetical protein